MKHLFVALVVVAIAVTASAQKKQATPAQEWQTYNHDLAGTRFSPLTEINTGNVAKLAQAWIVQVSGAPPGGGRRRRRLAARPKPCRSSSAA